MNSYQLELEWPIKLQHQIVPLYGTRTLYVSVDILRKMTVTWVETLNFSCSYLVQAGKSCKAVSFMNGKIDITLRLIITQPCVFI